MRPNVYIIAGPNGRKTEYKRNSAEPRVVRTLGQKMKKPPPNVLELPLHERALMALEAAVEGAMEEHARAGLPVYVMRDGKVVEISAQELRVLYPDYNRQEP